MNIISLATQLIFALYVLLDTLVDALTACACQSNPCPRLDPSDLAVPSILIFRPQAKLIFATWRVPRSRITRTDSISDHFQELKLLRLPISVREGTCPMCSGLTINLQLSID